MGKFESVRIIIGADIVPTQNSQKAFVEADMEVLLGRALKERLAAADLRIFNLECPLTERDNPIKKYGPRLKALPECVNGIAAIAPSCLGLANNHILDHGAEALLDTLCVLDEHHIEHCGAAKNLSEAAKAWVKTVKGLKIGVYACAEHEFSIAGENKPGANPYDPLESFDHVEKLRKECDCVIVLYHGGKEYYRYPSPEVQKVCRKFIQKGASLVVCQHSHCIGCAEQFESGTIVYGQGNFLFDKRDNEFWNQSVLVELTVDKERSEVCYIPLKRKTPGTSLASSAEGERILAEFDKRSQEIQKEGFVQHKYQEFVKENGKKAAERLDSCSVSTIYRILNKLSKGKLSQKHVQRFATRKADMLRNLVECEAWRELLLAYLNREER